MTYRVELPVFSGPMDLLLHLVKQQEVDIHDISISSILGDYLAHLDVLKAMSMASFVALRKCRGLVRPRVLRVSEFMPIV